ncbi:MAG: hypothetical protein J6Q76_06730, partial [Clostridia bacterium]|nr:hypothetical protein [Clostridia bacterium]
MDEIIEGIINAEKEAENIPLDENAENSDVAEEKQPQNDYLTEPKQREFNTTQSVFAYVCWLAGYLLCRIYPVVSSPLGGFLFCVGLFATASVFLKKQGAEFGKISVI